MNDLNWIIPLLAIWPLLQLLKLTLVARNVLGLRFSLPRVEGVPVEDLPAHFAELARLDVEELGKLGFVPRQAIRISESHLGTLVRSRLECSNADGTTRAIIARHPTQQLHADTRIILASTMDNGDVLVTASHDSERLLPSSPRLKFVALEWAGAQELATRHAERLAEAAARGIHPVTATAEEAVANEALLSREALDLFRASGDAAEDAGGRLHFRFIPGLRVARDALRAAIAKKKATQKRLRSGAMKPRTVRVGEEAQLQFDWETYQSLAALRKGKMSGTAKTLLMLGSLVLFCLALGWRLSPSTAVILLGVLVFHECGHLLGMRLFGFRDTQLLFLPFLGGVAVGRDAVILKPWQNLVMLFLGPLPGLFVGMGMLAYGGNLTGWESELASMLVFLNAFNLLPFLPLDGGQIVDTVLIGRFPYVKVIFTAASALALIAISVEVHGGTLLFVLGFFMLLRIPVEWRSAALLSGLRREIAPGTGEETAVRRVIRVLRGPKWAKVAIIQRLTMANALQARLRQPAPNWQATVLAIACYTSPIWLGLGILEGTGALRSRTSLAKSSASADAAGLPRALPAYVPGNIPDAKNAAVPLGEAVARIKSNMGRAGAAAGPNSVGNADSAYVAGVTALLRDAAGRSGFDPGPEEKDDVIRSVYYGEALGFLATQAANLRKLHDTNGALALSLDALRLEKHLQSIPAEWNLGLHLASTSQVWSVVEDTLADERGASPDLLAGIASQIDLPGNLAYARQAILLQHFAQERRLQRYSSTMAAAANQGIFMRALFWIMGSQGRERQFRADMMEGDLRAKAALDGIAQGRWPDRADLDFKKGGMGVVSIGMLAEDTARLLMANTALAICWQGQAKGRLPASFADIKVDWWRGVPNSPIGGHPLQWRETRGVGILSYPPDGTLPAGEDPFVPTADDLSWRLPARPRDSS
jgi:Zn-dependent protease